MTPLPTSPGQPFTYASGSEEKVVRVFEAPSTFVESLALAQGGSPAAAAAFSRASHAMGAAVAALGLSNKAVFQEDAQESSSSNGNGAGGGAGELKGHF